MKLFCLASFVVAGLLFVPNQGTAQEGKDAFFVIVNPQNPVEQIKRKKAARIFLKKTKKWENGWSVDVVDQGSKSSARVSFSKEVLKRSVSSTERYWQQRTFSGKTVPPRQESSDRAVISWVSSNKGAVGYVSKRPTSKSVKVIAIAY